MLIELGKYDPFGRRFLEKHQHLNKESTSDQIIDFSRLLHHSKPEPIHHLFSITDVPLIDLNYPLDELNAAKPGTVKNLAIQSEQEIYVHGATVVWSRKGRVVKSFSFNQRIEPIKKVLFAWFPIITDYHQDEAPPPFLEQQLKARKIPTIYDGYDRLQKRALCVVFEDRICVHFEDGLEYTVHIPFSIDNVVPLDIGLLVSSRSLMLQNESKEGTKSLLVDRYIDFLMTVKHPLRGPSPVRLEKKTTTIASKTVQLDSMHKILFATTTSTTESQPAIIVTFNIRDKSHYLWTYERRSRKLDKKVNAETEEETEETKDDEDISVSTRRRMSRASILSKKSRKRGSIIHMPKRFHNSRGEERFYDNELERGLYNAFIDPSEIIIRFLWKETCNNKVRKKLNEEPEVKSEAFLTHNLQGQELICILNYSLHQLQVIDVDKIMNETSQCVIFKTTAISAIPVNASRDQYKDLLFLDASKKAHLFVDPNVPCLVPLQFIDDAPRLLSDPVFERFSVHFENGDIKRYQFRLRPTSSLVIDSFAAVGCVSTQLFSQLWHRFIRYYRLTPHSIAPTEWESFFVTVLSLLRLQRVNQGAKEKRHMQIEQNKVSNNNLITKQLGFLPETLRDFSILLDQTQLEGVPGRWIDQLPVPINTTDATLFMDLLRSLHVLYEEYRIKKTTQQQAKQLGYLLMQCSVILGYRDWIAYYEKHGIQQDLTVNLTLTSDNDHDLIYLSPPPLPPPNIELCVQLMATASTTALLSFFGVSTLEPTIGYCQHGYSKTIKRLWSLYGVLNDFTVNKSMLLSKMLEHGIMLEEIKDLVDSLADPILKALDELKQNPAVDWEKESYLILERDDIFKQLDSKATVPDPNSSTFKLPPFKNTGIPRTIRDVLKSCRESSEAAQMYKSDSLDLETEHLRFGVGGYIEKVRVMLDAKRIPDLTIPSLDLNDDELATEHQSRVLMLIQRTLALSTGRAMYAYGTHLTSPIKPLPFEPITLAAKILPLRTVIHLEEAIHPESLEWPQFHNGVASGLRMSPNSNVTDSWINFCFPDNTEIEPQHGGLLLAMGLNGTIKHSPSVDWYRFVMQDAPDVVTLGILLGAAAAFKGTKDATLTKVLRLHIPALFPPDSHSFHHSTLIQATSVLGIGLVYMGQCERTLAMTMLEEIRKNAATDPSVMDPNYEAYGLSAGFSLGMITLGHGSRAVSAVDPELLNHLLELMKLNADVTAPGATIALALMYLKTNDRDVASLITLLHKRPYLNYIRPDLLLLRVVAKNVILWDDIVPSRDWIEAQLPDFMMEDHDDAVLQAKFHIIAGASLCLGLKYAGTKNADAFSCLFEQLDHFMQLLELQATTVQAGVTHCAIQTCVDVLCTACAMVMAGTGDRLLFDRLERLWARTTMTYGSHMAVSMSLGLLYLGLGGYTLKTTNESVAALLCAFYPFYPMDVDDNRYHLQLFRHLWVLALDTRWLVPYDVTSEQPCRLPLEVVDMSGARVRIVAPTVIPDYRWVKSITVLGDRYWPLKVDMTVNGHYQRSITQSSVLYVKRKKDKKSYEEDPNGRRSFHFIK